jgi:hypothetical protein
MALGSTQPLIEMSTRNLPGGRGVKSSWRVRLTASAPPVSWLCRKCGSLDVSQPYGPSRSLTGRAVSFALLYCRWYQIERVWYYRNSTIYVFQEHCTWTYCKTVRARIGILRAYTYRCIATVLECTRYNSITRHIQETVTKCRLRYASCRGKSLWSKSRKWCRKHCK